MSTHTPTYSGGIVEGDPALDKDNSNVEGWFRLGPRGYREPSTANKALLNYLWGNFFPEIRAEGVTEREIRDMIRSESDSATQSALILRYLEDFPPEQRSDAEFLVAHPEFEPE